MPNRRAVTGKIISNERIANGVYEMRIAEGFISETAEPGQFVNIYIPRADLLLPRPISVCETLAGEFRIVYQTIGEGTKYMSRLARGGEIKMSGPAGNGFCVNERAAESKKIIVAGGGIGVPPLLFLVKRLREINKSAEIVIFLGFKNESHVILTDDFKKYGTVRVSTDDGSFLNGRRGLVTDDIKDFVENANVGVIFSCGPGPMLKNISELAEENKIACFISMEERMACGTGACVGCAVKVKDNENGFAYKRVCHDGPVFNSREIIWNE